MTKQCIHFIGFRTPYQFWLAEQVFGKPDFIHVKYDIRTAFGGEMHPDDVLVFASDKDWIRFINNDPYPFAVDDSAADIPSDEVLTHMGL